MRWYIAKFSHQLKPLQVLAGIVSRRFFLLLRLLCPDPLQGLPELIGTGGWGN